MTEESIFAAALSIPDPIARAAYLDGACGNNQALRREVEALLAAHDADNPLDRAPVDLALTGAYVPGAMNEEASAGIGDRIGPYKLLEKIGEGGMGEVWVADQQEPIKRRVALKLIKPGMDSRSVLGRFEAERQALAVMDHPNIAKVLDAGTTKGEPGGVGPARPYFVMELVKGTPITEFCDVRKLTPKERLELFVPVCQAIQHAHMKGIIHRDIKPSNVLVELHDDRPVPKVIDFGVAKAVGQQLTEKTIYTGFGALIGTPAYMAPEQATFNALDVDTRADVYALGVLLYELLAGSPPIEQERLKRAALDEVLRIVREEEPQRPSQRLSTSQTKASIAATRQTEPAKLSKLMKGELDWIVMKSLEKDRTRRYETANGFAADVQRYLSGEQVQAVPPSFGYRMWKAYRRNKTAVRVGCFMVMILIVGIMGTTWQAFRAERQAERAEEEARRVRREEQKTLAALELAQKNQQKADAALEVAQKNQQKAEVILCRSILRPIGYQTDEGKLDAAELRAFVEPYRWPDDRMNLLCFQEGLSDAATALRVARRAERFVQATIGASPARRRAALEFLTPIQQEANADARIRLAACWLAIELHSEDWTGFEASVNYLASLPELDWINFLTPTLLSRVNPTQAATLANSFAEQLLAPATSNSPFTASRCLRLIAPKLDSATTYTIAERLLARRLESKHANVLGLVADTIPALAPRLQTAQVDRLLPEVFDLVDIISDPKQDRWAPLKIVAVLAPRASDARLAWFVRYVLSGIVDNKLLDYKNGNAVLKVLAAGASKVDAPTRERIIKVLRQDFEGRLTVDVVSYSRNQNEVADLLAALETNLDQDVALELAKSYLERKRPRLSAIEDWEGPARILQILTRRMRPEKGHDVWVMVVEWLLLGRNAKDPILSSGMMKQVKHCRWIGERIPRESADKIASEWMAKYKAGAWTKEGVPAPDVIKALPLLTPGLSIDVATVIVEDALALIRTNERLWWDDYVGLLNATCDRLPGELAQKKREAAFEVVASRLMEKAEREYESAVVVALVQLVQAMPIESREPYRKTGRPDHPRNGPHKLGASDVLVQP